MIYVWIIFKFDDGSTNLFPRLFLVADDTSFVGSKSLSSLFLSIKNQKNYNLFRKRTFIILKKNTISIEICLNVNISKKFFFNF